ncbi:MAG: hypothetical protein BGO01_15490 [Armatimonadetes bacterium 55-13]|nr:MAG: hypothetical protein BGO01_15490 [Armatimonadetes bacterium 55-13]
MLIPMLACGAIITAVQQPQLFSDDDKRVTMTYWSDPQRYRIVPPTDFRAKGLWQVRLTVEGSTWLWNFNRARGVSMKPTSDSEGHEERDKVWDAWIDAKVNYDRWVAGQVAAGANAIVVGNPPTVADTSVPVDRPQIPGPMPADMLAFVQQSWTSTVGLNQTINPPPGPPPIFAEAVVPMEYRIKFEDAEISYQDNCMRRAKYPYYRFDEGVLSAGKAVRTMPEKDLDKLIQMAGVSPSEARVMKAVSILEGGFDSVNTYDTGYVSVGFIQFATLKDGAGSLGQLLLNYKQTNPDEFQRDFRKYGIDVTPLGVLSCLDWQTGAEVQGGDANKQIIKDKRLIAVFQRAGQKSSLFNAAQIRIAKNQYYPANDTINIGLAGVSFTGKVTDFIKSEAGMATLMDRKVNTGKIDVLIPVLQKTALTHSVKSFADFAKYERQIIEAVKYRRDYLKDQTLSQPS